jgi:hypothetical protein
VLNVFEDGVFFKVWSFCDSVRRAQCGWFIYYVVFHAQRTTSQKARAIYNVVRTLIGFKTARNA